MARVNGKVLPANYFVQLKVSEKRENLIPRNIKSLSKLQVSSEI